jgi:hypothetical protein
MAAEIDALNYPYIRVRSIDWLKRTLLIFPHVVRMTPFVRAPADDPEISAFAQNEGDQYPLLRSADLHSKHVYVAQQELIAELRSRLEADRDDFRSCYGRQAGRLSRASLIGENLTVWERRLSPHATFQIHAYKLFDELTAFLHREGLAWIPHNTLADGPDYLEMHPNLGEAVMATLAVACAENEGLQVVTEFPELHSKLLGTPRDKILTACLDGVKPTGATSGQQIAEFLVYRRCNVDMLSAENIVTLRDERAALVDFRRKLDDLAKTLPPTIYSEKHLQERLNETLDDMFKQWEREQANMGNVARRFFGEGIGSELKRIGEKLVEAALKPETGQEVTKGAAIGGLAGVPAGHVLTGIGAGFAVALVFRGFEGWSKARRNAKTSPLRYLTRLQERGVSFSVAR